MNNKIIQICKLDLKNKSLISCLVLGWILLFFNASTAEQKEFDSSYKDKTMRDLIIQLNDDYLSMDKAVLKLEEGMKESTSSTLNMSVIRRDKDSSLSLISIDVMDKSNRLFKAHIYNSSESEALKAGGRHQLFNGEFRKGSHVFKIDYIWKKENGNAQKDEIFIPASIEAGSELFIELSFEKKEGKLELHYNTLKFQQ